MKAIGNVEVPTSVFIDMISRGQSTQPPESEKKSLCNYGLGIQLFITDLKYDQNTSKKIETQKVEEKAAAKELKSRKPNRIGNAAKEKELTKEEMEEMIKKTMRKLQFQ